MSTMTSIRDTRLLIMCALLILHSTFCKLIYLITMKTARASVIKVVFYEIAIDTCAGMNEKK